GLSRSELEPLRLGGQPGAEEDEVREDLVALVLEVMLGRPQRVVAQLVHVLGHFLRGLKRLGEALVGITAIVGGSAREPDVLELNLSHVKSGELRDHFALQPPSTTME